MSESHKLHKQIGRLFESMMPDFAGSELLLDSACKTGAHNLPLFMAPIGNKEFHFCSVDGLIHQAGKVILILEIDESGRKPLKLFGKAFVPTGCSHYVYKKNVFPFAATVHFIQVFSTHKFQKNKIVLQKWQNVGEKIQELLDEQKNTTRFTYRLFLGDYSDFIGNGKAANDLAEYVKEILKN